MKPFLFLLAVLMPGASTFAYSERGLLNQALESVVPGESSLDLFQNNTNFMDGVYQNGERTFNLDEKSLYCLLQVQNLGIDFITEPVTISEIETSLWGDETIPMSYRTSVKFSAFDAQSHGSLVGEITCHKPYHNEYDPITIGELEATLKGQLAFSSVRIKSVQRKAAHDPLSPSFAVTPAHITGIKSIEADGTTTVSRLVLSLPKDVKLERQEDDKNSKDLPFVYSASFEDGKAVVGLPSFKKPHMTVYVYTNYEQTNLDLDSLGLPSNVHASAEAQVFESVVDNVKTVFHNDSSMLNLDYTDKKDRLISIVFYRDSTTAPVTVETLSQILGTAPVHHFDISR